MIRLITYAPRFVQLEELLGRRPTPEEFRAQQAPERTAQDFLGRMLAIGISS
jgi:hypothetical protein